MTDEKIVCPQCGRADSIRKVRSIVSDGTTYTDSTRLGMSLSRDAAAFYNGLGNAVSRTALASVLASPAKPSEPHRKGWSGIFPGLRMNCAGSVLGFIILIAVCSFPLFYPTYRENPLLLFLPVGTFIIAAAVLLRWAWLSNRRDRKQLQKAQTSYPLELQQWERAMARWEQLYYCSRDHGVFLPSHAQITDVKNMHALLYAQDKRKR